MSTSYKPLISVVTVVLNDQHALRKTAQSVLKQNYKNIEYIIIDGGSIDGTVEFVKSLEPANVKWISETDKGIYHAMNKGTNLSLGEWVIFLNAGDIFVDESVITDVFTTRPYCYDLIYGDTYFVESDTETLVCARSPELLWQALNFNHNSLFTRREILIEHPFTDQYKIVADSEFVIWAYQSGKSFHNTGIAINKYNVGGYSDMNSVMRTVERWKLVSDTKMKNQFEINNYYFQRLLWEDSCKDYLFKTYNIKI